MTQDEIVKLAREAGLLVVGTADGGEAVYTWPKGITDELECFAGLVRAAEREACAKVCDGMDHDGVMIAADCAAAIRARGEQ